MSFSKVIFGVDCETVLCFTKDGVLLLFSTFLAKYTVVAVSPKVIRAKKTVETISHLVVLCISELLNLKM